MPALDGPQTLAELRRVDPGVVACFMSGDTESYEPESLARLGSGHPFAKPFRLEELAGVLRSLTRAGGGV